MKIDQIPEVRFRSGWDYFLYGLGKNLIWFWLVVGLIVMVANLK